MKAANNIKVITPENAAAGAKRKGDSFLSVTKRPGSKPVQGTTFYQVAINGLTLDAQGKEERASGFFSIENVKIQGCKDPSKNTNGVVSKPTLSARYSELGETATFLRGLNSAWHKAVQENLTKPDPDNKDLTVMDLTDRKVHDIGQWKYSGKSLVKDKDGKLLKNTAMLGKDGQEDPIMRWKLAFGKVFHEKCPFAPLRGKPQCIIRDGTKPIVENGKKTFALATVNIDGVDRPVDETNVHLFITGGSTLVKGRYMINSASQSQSWISLEVAMIEATIIPGSGVQGFDDEDIDDTTLDATVDDYSAQERPVPTAHVVPIDTDKVKSILADI